MATFSAEDLKGWYAKYNYLYFKGQLKQCPIYINHTKRALGQFCRDCDGYGIRYYIKISNFLDRPIRDVQNTLIHEMIHQWQWENFQKCDHGDTFKQKAKEINTEGGWNVARCNSTEGCAANYVRPNKVFQICIFKRNGRFCQSVLASNRVDYFKRWVPDVDGISDLHFGTSTDSKLNEYTCSRKKLSWQWIEEEEFNQIKSRIA